MNVHIPVCVLNTFVNWYSKLSSSQQFYIMLYVCHQYCVEWDSMFNVKKSNVMVIGKDDELLLPDMILGGGLLS